MNELHPDAQRMLFEHPERRTQALQQQNGYSTRQQSQEYQAQYYEEDNNQYDVRSETEPQEYSERRAQFQQDAYPIQEDQGPFAPEHYEQHNQYSERPEPQIQEYSEGPAQATSYEYADSLQHNQNHQTPQLEEEGEVIDGNADYQAQDNPEQLPQIVHQQQYADSTQYDQEQQASYPEVDKPNDDEHTKQMYTNPERLALIAQQQHAPPLPLDQQYQGLNPERLAQIEKQQFADSLQKRNREYQAQAPYHEDPRQRYDEHSKTGSQRRNQLRARTERLSPELQALRERAMATKGRRDNTSVGTSQDHHALRERAMATRGQRGRNSQVDHSGHVPHLGFDAKHRPYYSIILEDNQETCDLLIGRIGENGINIKTVEHHFGLRFLQFQKHSKRVSIWVEDDGPADYIDEERRKRLRFAWHFLQAWADQVVRGRNERAQRSQRFWIPTIREYLEETWKDCEARGRYPEISREPQEPSKVAPELPWFSKKQLKRKAREDFERDSENRSGVPPDLRHEEPSHAYRGSQLGTLEGTANDGEMSESYRTSAEERLDGRESNFVHQDRIRR